MINDRFSDEKLKEVHPDLAERWRAVRHALWDLHEKQIKVTEGFRSCKRQWELYKLGRHKTPQGEWTVINLAKVVTYAKGGDSLHNYGLAIDSAFTGNDPYLERVSPGDSSFLWNEYGRLCLDNGLTWGGNWKHPKTDRPHCQASYKISLDILKMLYESGGVDAVFTKCNQIIHCGRELA